MKVNPVLYANWLAVEWLGKIKRSSQTRAGIHRSLLAGRMEAGPGAVLRVRHSEVSRHNLGPLFGRDYA